MYFFTSDQHFNHRKIIKYCNRPYNSVEEMNESIISNHNEVVGKNDVVIHAGDFAFVNRESEAQKIFKRLNGNHIYLKGNHDRWMPKGTQYLWKKVVNKKHIAICHYAMRIWPGSHYGGWNLHGHSHGTLPPMKNQYDIGVDNNNYYPVSFDQLLDIMRK